MFRLLAVWLCAAAPVALAGIVKENKVPPSESGVAIPKPDAPIRLQCWIDGWPQVVEAYPPQLPPATTEPTTQVVIRNPDGTTTVVVVPGGGASGCLPVR